jgi:hypothetical protein
MIADPMNINRPPKRNQALGATRNRNMLKSTTKKGYAISIIEAEDAPTNFMAEKIK